MKGKDWCMDIRDAYWNYIHYWIKIEENYNRRRGFYQSHRLNIYAISVSILETVMRICRTKISTENLDFGILCGITIAICTLHCRQKFDDRGYTCRSHRAAIQGLLKWCYWLSPLLTSEQDYWFLENNYWNRILNCSLKSLPHRHALLRKLS